MKSALMAALLLILTIGGALAADDIFGQIAETAPVMDDTFTDIDRKSP